MRFLIKLVIVVVLVLMVVYFVSGVGEFDPSKQGRDARAAIGPGMTWTQVFDITDDPKKYRPIRKRTKRIGGETIEYLEPGPENKSNRASFVDRLNENTLPHGFLCTFRYSNSVAFTVSFDGTGTVVAVQDAMTMADLLQYDRD